MAAVEEKEADHWPAEAACHHYHQGGHQGGTAVAFLAAAAAAAAALGRRSGTKMAQVAPSSPPPSLSLHAVPRHRRQCRHPRERGLEAFTSSERRSAFGAAKRR